MYFVFTTTLAWPWPLPHSLTNPSHKSASSLAHPFFFGLALRSRAHYYICNKCCSYSLWSNQTHLILMLIKCKQKSILHKKRCSQKAGEVEIRWFLTILIFFMTFLEYYALKITQSQFSFLASFLLKNLHGGGYASSTKNVHSIYSVALGCRCWLL